jgi:hypothetical protein
MTHWVAKAFKRVYLEHKDAIIACFKSVGLSLAVDGSEDHLLNVRDCLNLTIGDWQQAPEESATAPILVDDNTMDMIEVEDNNDGLLYTAQEVTKGITIKEEDKNNMTTDLGVSFNERFNTDLESDFDDDINGDEDIDDENM